MTDFKNRINSLELRASESKLIGDLATNPEARIYNMDLPKELRAEADRLKKEGPVSPGWNILNKVRTRLIRTVQARAR